MTTPPPEQHQDIRRHFEDELEAIKQGTVALCSLVLENTRRLGEALVDNRLDLAQHVIDADLEVDERYARLERKTFLAIALQQPVAGDLRLLISITRMLYEIERTGDLVVNAAKGLIRQKGYRLSPQVHGVLARLSSAAADLMSEAIDALIDMDPTAGRRLDEHDDVVDALVGEFYSLIAGEASDLHVDTAIELSRTGRYLERIADHGVNIGDHVTFIVTGSFPRHSVEAAADADE